MPSCITSWSSKYRFGKKIIQFEIYGKRGWRAKSETASRKLVSTRSGLRDPLRCDLAWAGFQYEEDCSKFEYELETKVCAGTLLGMSCKSTQAIS